MDNIYLYLENIRNESMTRFFKLFPYLASDYFYIIALAIGYWAYPKKKPFIDLGFLIPITTVINIILKNVFHIPRPHHSLHLVPFHIDYGFPSGDVQVAVVFWGTIFSLTKLTLLRIAAILIVIGISISRIYLGVHSIIDVIGGLLFGYIILFSYNTSFFQTLRNEWFKNNSRKSYWFISLAISLLYVCTTLTINPISHIALASIGVLFGLGISLKYVKIFENNERTSIIRIFCSLTVLFIFYKIFPIYKSFYLLEYISIIIKYTVLAIIIYVFVPFFLWKENFRN